MSFEKIINTNSYKLEAKSLKANSYKRQSKSENISTEQKATMLIETLKADMNYLRWFCKIVNTLPENIIQNILEGARKANFPDRYFTSAAKIELAKQSPAGFDIRREGV